MREVVQHQRFSKPVNSASLIKEYTALPRDGYTVVRVLLGLLLLVAAALKGHELATMPVLGNGLLASRPFLIVLVEFELLLGLCLLVGLAQERTRQVALLFFVGLAGFSLYKVLIGDAACDCFGRVRISPWGALAIDVLSVAALLWWRPSAKSRSFTDGDGWISGRPALGSSVIAGVTFAAGIPLAIAMSSYTPALLSDDGKLSGRSRNIVLQPEDWVGKKLPLIDYIDIGDQLEQSEWTLVLYRYDCPLCQRVLSRYTSTDSRLLLPDFQQRVALVEVPPHVPAAPPASMLRSSRLVWGRLDDKWRWHVAIPTELMLQRGRVVQVRNRDELTRTR